MKSILAVATGAVGLFASTAVASASTNVRRTTINDITTIKSQVDQLTKDIKAWNASDPNAYATALYTIYNPSLSTVYYLGNVTVQLEKTPVTFTIDDAFRIAGSVQDLAYSVNASVAALNSVAQPFYAKAITQLADQALGELLNATKSFASELISNVPTKLRPIAYALQSQALDSIQQGIDCQNNPNNTVACNTDVVDPDLTHNLALHWGAIRPDGSPIA